MRIYSAIVLVAVAAVSSLSMASASAATVGVSGITFEEQQALEANQIRPGDIVKGTNSSLYYISPDYKRYIFPKDTVFFSWISDFSKVKTFTQDRISGVPIGGNIGAKPGSLIQFVSEDTSGRIVVSDPNVYVVDDVTKSVVNQIWKIQDANQAVQYFGSDWEKKIIPVLESLYTNYTLVGNYTANVYVKRPLYLVDDFRDVYWYTNDAIGFKFEHVPEYLPQVDTFDVTKLPESLHYQTALINTVHYFNENWSLLVDGATCSQELLESQIELYGPTYCHIINKINTLGQRMLGYRLEDPNMGGNVAFIFISGNKWVRVMLPSAGESYMLPILLNSFQFTN